MELRNKTLKAGVQLVKVKDIRYALNSKNELRTTKSGHCGLNITFIDVNNNSASQVFWLTEKSKWIFKNFCSAISLSFSLIENLIDESEVEKVKSNVAIVSAEHAKKSREAFSKGRLIASNGDRAKCYKILNEAVGKVLYILVAEHYRSINGFRKVDDNGKAVFETVVLPHFYPVIDGNSPPVLPGDPKYNNGVCADVFLIETNFNTNTNYSNNMDYDDSSDDYVMNPMNGNSYSRDWVSDVFGMDPDDDFIPWSNID